MADRVDTALLVPSSRVRTPRADQPAQEDAPYAGRMVLELREIAEQGPFDFLVNADYVRIQSKFPVRVEFDGQLVVSGYTDHNLVIGASSGQYAAAASDGIAQEDVRPGMSFVYDRPGVPVRMLRLSYDSFDLVPYQERELWGDVHVFYGRGGVTQMDFGLPGSVAHSITETPGGSFTFRTYGPFFPTVVDTNDNAATTVSQRPVPSRWELSAIHVLIGWAGAAGNITVVAIGRLDRNGTSRFMRAYRPGTERFTVEMSNGPIFEGLAVREVTGGAAGGEGIIVFVQTSVAMTSAQFDFGWRYWM